jgi:hypothetical protein
MLSSVSISVVWTDLVKNVDEMTKDEEFRLKQQQMPDKELAELARNEISKLCKTGGKSLTMCVPPRVTDTDMLLCEVIRRFESLVNVDEYGKTERVIKQKGES